MIKENTEANVLVDRHVNVVLDASVIYKGNTIVPNVKVAPLKLVVWSKPLNKKTTI